MKILFFEQSQAIYFYYEFLRKFGRKDNQFSSRWSVGGKSSFEMNADFLLFVQWFLESLLVFFNPQVVKARNHFFSHFSFKKFL
jgi:hypothetical protein